MPSTMRDGVGRAALGRGALVEQPQFLVAHRAGGGADGVDPAQLDFADEVGASRLQLACFAPWP